MPKIILRQTTPEPATAIVQDQDGNELARQDIASGATQIITVNAQTMINVAKGDFTGVFDLSVKDQNGFYNDYTEGSVINTLSLAASPKLGSIATVRILGGLLGANAIPNAWDNFSSDAISQDNTQFNVLTILYVAADDVRIVNNVIAAPDFVAPEFTSSPTATNITETSFDITAQLNENGTVYAYLLADGSPSPTIQEIIDNAQSQFSDTGSGGTLSFTGLTVDTNYDVYVVAEDTAGNRQANSTLVEVLTVSSQTAGDIAVARFSTLTNAEETAIKTAVDDLDSLGKWDLIDEAGLFIGLTNEADALTGLKSKTFTKIGNPTYNNGFTFSTGNCINTNFIPSVDGVNYTLNNNSTGAEVIENNSVTNANIFGALGSGGNDRTNLKQISTTLRFFNNSSGELQSTIAGIFQNNTFYTNERTLSSSGNIIRDGVKEGWTSFLASAMPDVSMYVGDRNNQGVADQGISGKLGFWFIGAAGIDDADFQAVINQLYIDLGL